MRKTTQGMAAVTIVTAAGLLAPASVAYAAASPVPSPTPGAPLLPIVSGAKLDPFLIGKVFRAGAVHGGDPYFPDFGNGGYNVGHYDLRLKYDPIGKLLDGTAVLTAKATRNLSSFGLDLQSTLNVSAVSINGKPAKKFTQSGAHKLVITPSEGLYMGTPFTVTVVYSGVPMPVQEAKGGLGTYGWVTTGDGAVTVNQPVGADTWFPVNESNTQKATYSYHVTVPKDLTVLANGEPTGAVPKGTAQKTYGWEMRHPIAPEMAMVAIGKFEVTRTTAVNGTPDITAIQSTLQTKPAQGKAFNKTTSDVLKWETGIFGRYPFGSTGGIMVTSNVGYSLETQGRPVYDTDTADLNSAAVLTIVHELAHQWFGNSLTPARWSDLWLNESFATYTEWMYGEKNGGLSVQKRFEQAYALAANDARWKVETASPGRNHIFDWAVYERGAMALHQLRKQLGDKAFFELVKRWAAEHKDGNVSTAQFIALAEQVAHKPLQTFFTEWLFSKTKPSVTLK